MVGRSGGVLAVLAALLAVGMVSPLPAEVPRTAATAVVAASPEDPGAVEGMAPPDVGASQHDRAAAGDDLPAPFNAWDVTLTPSEEEPRWLELAFDSPTLGLRAHSVVIVPRTYADRGAPSGTLYYLHGTSQVYLEPAQGLLEQAYPSYYAFSPGRGYWVAADLDHPDQRYLTVVLDVGDPHWCGSCYWTEGRDGMGVNAETHLYDELIPLIEVLFNVRQDRGGRGLAGHSMGGTGVMIQGTRHPDRWAYVGSMSPSLFKTQPLLASAMPWFAWSEYLRGQGYTAEDEIGLRGVDPVELATNLAGQNVETFIYVGDGCPAHDPDNPCRSVPDQPHAGAAAAGWLWDAEGQYRLYMEAASAHLARVGVPHHFVKRDGGHVDMANETYAEMMVDRINRVFEREVADPAVFSYKSVDARFDVWGYQVEVTRPNTEFLHLLSARIDGRDFVLAGTGEASVTLPPAFKPNRDYHVMISSEDGTTTECLATARPDAALELRVPLGPPRELDESLALVEAGEFLFPHSRVEVLEALKTGPGIPEIRC